MYYLVMEYVEGIDLDSWCKKQTPLPIDWVCECIRQAALGLQHAHEQGLVHRDIKPSNLLVVAKDTTTEPLVKILDMGIAQFTRPERQKNANYGHRSDYRHGRLYGARTSAQPQERRCTF